MNNMPRGSKKQTNNSPSVDKQVSNDEWLQFLHQLHNIIRGANNVKLTGMAALNEINNLLVLFFAEPHIEREMENDKGLTEFCKFSYLHEKYASDERIEEDEKTLKCFTKEARERKLNRQILWQKIYKIDQKDEENYCVLQRIASNDYLSRYIYDDVLKMSIYSIKSEIAETIQKIINMMHKKLKDVKFTHEFYDAFGSAYERFKTDYVGNAGKGTGQHFTPVSIKKFIIEELKPQSDELYYEPCAGSGGFIHTAYSHVFKQKDGNAEKFKENIYANECNPEIIKPLKINMMLHDIHTENIREMDSLSCDNCKDYYEKFDLVATNPPFGMKTTMNPSTYMKVGSDNYWNILVRGKTMIKDSSGQFVMHIYHSLKKIGRCGFVIDRGIINNGSSDSDWQVQLRKFLFENANVYLIVLLPTGIFKYTNFETAIIFFKKGEKTKTVSIYQGMFEDENKKEGLKIDIKNPDRVFTIDELIANDYSLKCSDDIIPQCIDDVNSCSLGSICTFLGGKRRTIDEQTTDGEYNFYTCSILNILKSTNNDFHEEALIINAINGSGKCCIHIGSNYSLTSNNIHFKPKNDSVNIKYLYYYLKINIKLLENGFTGGNQKKITIDYMQNNIQIQIPEKLVQNKIIKFLDTNFDVNNISRIADELRDYPIFNLLIEQKYDMFESIITIINRKLEAKAMMMKFEQDKKAVFNIMLNGVECGEKVIDDVCTIRAGTHLSDDMKIIGTYPVYGGGNILMYINKFNREDEIIISRMGVSMTCIRYEKRKFFLTEHGWTLECKKCIDKKFLYYYLITNNEKVYKLASGSAQKGISQVNFGSLEIQVPSLDDQQKIITKMQFMNTHRMMYANYVDYLNETLKTLIGK